MEEQLNTRNKIISLIFVAFVLVSVIYGISVIFGWNKTSNSTSNTSTRLTQKDMSMAWLEWVGVVDNISTTGSNEELMSNETTTQENIEE